MSDTIASFNVEYTRFLDPSGRATQPFPDGTSDRATLVKLYRAMVLTRTFDAKGVNLSIVQGSGPDGVATKGDVERAARVLASAAPAEPLRGVRRAMADRMSKAHAEVPRATVTDDADVNAWNTGLGHASSDPRHRGRMPIGPGAQCLVRASGDDPATAPPRRSRRRHRYRGQSLHTGSA